MQQRAADTALADAELIRAVRTGDTAAFGDLFDRHRGAARRLAQQLAAGADADDLVADAFVRVLGALQHGKGPDEFFRAYLFTVVRRLHVDRLRAAGRVRPTDDESELDRPLEVVDPAERRFDQSAATTAFGSLPERWQLVLWHLDVEGQRPSDVAPLLGMSANSVSALAYRAREGLRQAYLQNHLAQPVTEACRTTIGLLGRYVRGGLSRRDARKVESHLESCRHCTGLRLELSEVNSNLAGILGPAVLGSVFVGYAGTVGTEAVPASASGVVDVAKSLADPIKNLGSTVSGAGAQGVIAAAVVTMLAAAGTIGLTTTFEDTGADITAAPQRTVTPQDRGTGPRSPAVRAASVDRVSVAPVDELDRAPVASSTPAPRPKPPVKRPEVPPATTPPSAATPPPTPEPAPEPEPEPAVAPTDYAVSAPAITADDTLLQRRFTVPITAANDGRATDQVVTVTMQFNHPVRFRGVASAGWDCGAAARNRHLQTLSCTSTLPAGQGATFIAKAIGLRPTGTVSIEAADDPRADNNLVSFRAAPYALGH